MTGAEKQKRYRQRHPERVKAAKARYRSENMEKIREANRRRQATYRVRHRNRVRDAWLKWKYKDVDSARRKVREYRRQRIMSDLNYRIISTLRSRLSLAIRGKIKKMYKHKELLGCTIDELKFYLEGKFTDGMTWGNHGLNGWHIDHIVPLSFFDLSDPDQLRKAAHYTNLQPLWAKENRVKHARLVTIIH